jgi:hypothetical protein
VAGCTGLGGTGRRLVHLLHPGQVRVDLGRIASRTRSAGSLPRKLTYVPSRSRNAPAVRALPAAQPASLRGGGSGYPPARVCSAVRVRECRDGRHDDRLLGREVPLLLLAPQPRDPAGRHRREPGHLARARLAAAHQSTTNLGQCVPQVGCRSFTLLLSTVGLTPVPWVAKHHDYSHSPDRHY